MNYIVLDLEFNQYFDFKDPRYVNEPACPFEIMQLGAVKLNDDFETVDRANFFVKPQIFLRMHPFVQKITGITLAGLKHEPCFDEVYDAFLKFAGTEKYVLCAWGVSDIRLLFKNILYHKLNSKLLTKKYIDVQQIASEHFGHAASSSIGLKNAVQNLGIAENGDFHDAMNDAAYAAEVFRAVRRPEMTVSVFDISGLRHSILAAANFVNSGTLFHFCELNLGRKLSDKEKDLILNVYIRGQKRRHDMPGGREKDQAARKE